MKENYKDTWREFEPPMVPIYFIGLKDLETLFKNDPKAITPEGLEVMLGYFEEYEKYEHAALVRDNKTHRGLFGDLPIGEIETDAEGPPDDGHKWTKSEDGRTWLREISPEEFKRLGFDKKDDDSGEEPTNPSIF